MTELVDVSNAWEGFTFVLDAKDHRSETAETPLREGGGEVDVECCCS